MSSPVPDPAGRVATPPELASRLARGLGGSPRVLDPACGEGGLLEAALAAAGRDRSFGARGLFGIERDPELARRARARLRRLVPGIDAEARVRCADALDPDVPWPAGTAVLANPPWVSFSGRRAAPTPGVAARFAGVGGGWPSLQGAFLARIARHVGRERTGARVLLPASVLDLPGYGALRREVTRWSELARPPEDLGEDAFPGIVGPCALVELRARAAEASGSDASWLDLVEPAHPEDRRLLAALESFPRLPPAAFADPGVHTGNAARQLVARGDRPAAGAWAPLREGRDVGPHRAGRPRAWLRTDLAPGGGLRFRAGPLERYAAFPILVRQTADRPIAALHREPAAFRNSLLAGRAVEGLDPALVVAVLNGPVAAAWHRLRHRDARQRAFPQVKVRHLREQPFPLGSPACTELAAGARQLAGVEPSPREVHALGELALRAFGLPPELAARVRDVAGVSRGS